MFVTQKVMEKKVIIVTGSCGRIGTAVVKRLGERYSIVGFELLQAIYASDQEELVPVDLSSDESVQQAFNHIRHFYGNRIASVIHLAAYYSFSAQHSPKYDTITVKGTERLLKALKEFEVEQFLFTSTMLVHAPTKPGHPINEESLVAPEWDYPLSKTKTEALIHSIRGDIPTVILRISGVYTDRCDSIPISNQIQRIYERSLESRLFAGNIHHGASFVHMDDLVDCIEAAVDRRKELPPELVLLIGEPHTMTYEDLQQSISKILFNETFHTFSVPKWFAKIGSWAECHIPFREKPFIQPWMIDLADDHYELNIEKAQKYLGWTPRHSLEKTLPIMIDILKQDPVHWYRANHLKVSPKMQKNYGKK